jgi:hypothetical protein
MRLSGKLSEAIRVKSPKEMGFKAPKASVPSLPRGKFVVSKDVVRRLRKDFLDLMKNTKKIKNESDIRTFVKAVNKYRMLIWRLREQIAHELDVRGGRGSGGWLHTAGERGVVAYGGTGCVC